MIDRQAIDDLSRKNQTTRDNVIREYCQHLFLSNFYRQKETEKILFKGGTALRLLWRSPRFSEDLDFTGAAATQGEIEEKIEGALVEIEREGIGVVIDESKKTTGGYLGKLFFRCFDSVVPILIEVSGRGGRRTPSYEETLIQNDFIPSYTLLHLPQEEMIREKIQALLDRAKPRDFFDLYFILRGRMEYRTVFRRDKTLKQKILSRLRETDQNFSRELKQFLPASHHSLLKNFRSVLEREISRCLP